MYCELKHETVAVIIPKATKNNTHVIRLEHPYLPYIFRMNKWIVFAKRDLNLEA